MLVATSLIEVGIDVPNATVMIVEGAERFGLAQLHQLRGRVGRGSEKSYCLLFSIAETGSSQARLEALLETNDGFELADRDLEIRGEGQVLGSRQAGVPDLKLARLARDREALVRARELAAERPRRRPRAARPRQRAAQGRRGRRRSATSSAGCSRPDPAPAAARVYCRHAHSRAHRHAHQHRLRRLRGDGRRAQALPRGPDQPRRSRQPQRPRVPGAARRRRSRSSTRPTSTATASAG